MATPTFNGTDLTTDAEKNVIGPRQARIFIETIPGANGTYMQGHGTGARPLGASGLLSATGASGTLARNALMTAFRAKEALIDGVTIAAFVGTDGNSYSNCVLQTYNQTSPITIATDPAGFKAFMGVSATLIQLVP